MNLQFFKAHREFFSNNEQSGILIPIIALSLIAIFTLFGLAIDGGRLYASHHSAQTWADSAAYAAAATATLEAGLHGAIDTALETKAENAGTAVATQTATFNGYIPNSSSTQLRVTVDMDPGSVPNPSATAIVEYDVPLYILPAIPGVGNVRTARAEARVEIMPALGYVAIDSSGSMLCPSSTDCGCFPNCGSDAAAIADQRFNSIISILQHSFLDRFDNTRDQIGVLYYDKAVYGLTSIIPGGGFIDMANLTNLSLYSNRPGGYDVSNPTLALYRAFSLLNSEFQSNPRRAPFITLIGDGAPTATCFKPATPHVTGDFASGQIACLWEIFWEGFKEPELVQDTPEENHKKGISRIGRVASYDAVPNAANARHIDPPFSDGSGGSFDYTVPCSTVSFPGWGAEMANGDFGNPENGATEVGGCFNDYRFIGLDGVTYPTDSNEWPLTNLTGEGETQWRKLFYNTAIVMADFVRSRGYVLFTIGLGLREPNSNLADTSDHLYGGSERSNLGLKANFMERMALQYNAVDNEYPGIPTHAGHVGNHDLRKGEFFAVDNLDISALQTHFKYIETRVKLAHIR